MTPHPSSFFAAGVYDPSYLQAETSSYWQWTSAQLGKDWDLAAESVNAGWPAEPEFKAGASRWHGVVRCQAGGFWVYRIYREGRDSYGREGRYFFVIIRLDSVEQLLDPMVAGLFAYFEKEHGLPLDTEPLDRGWQGVEADPALISIERKLRKHPEMRHWGVDSCMNMKELPDRTSDMPQPPKPPVNYRLFTAAGPVAIGLLLLLWIGFYWPKADRPELKKPDGPSSGNSVNPNDGGKSRPELKKPDGSPSGKPVNLKNKDVKRRPEPRQPDGPSSGQPGLDPSAEAEPDLNPSPGR